MPSIHNLPTELLTSIFTYLPFESQISAIQVSSLWRTILSSPICQKTRYTGIDGANPSSSSSSSLQIHKLLHHYHYSSSNADSKSIMFLISSMTIPPTTKDPNQTITKIPHSFEVTVENPNPQNLSSIESYIPLPKSHPFLSEPLFLPPCSSPNHINNSTTFKKIYRLYRITFTFRKHQKDFVTTNSSTGFLDLTSDISIRKVLTDALDEIETFLKGLARDDSVAYEYPVRFWVVPNLTDGHTDYPSIRLQVRVG
ncbi:hypothetical protein EYR41_009907 [Orbilia oligospora]|uniref:F-box domain-containing protein n=1 Tax=Orbilia oligospora TaxID=2813651 RepID=A0A8H2DR73_ORBOL|nr:hypothetical protein EYR41_009907 [Orbilia oligospora]